MVSRYRRFHLATLLCASRSRPWSLSLLRPGDIVLVALEPGEVGDVVVLRDPTGIVRNRRNIGTRKSVSWRTCEAAHLCVMTHQMR